MPISTSVSYGDPNFTPSYSQTPSWDSSTYGAYGTQVGSAYPSDTAAGNQTEAIALGQQQYAQLPGYSSSLANVGSNIQAETAGQLPQDVINQITQQAAERGIATGSPGSQNSNASYLQALGLNSLQLTNTGQQNLQSILPTLPGLNSSQIAADQITPGLSYQAAEQNAVNAAAPNPAAAARVNSAALTGGLNYGGTGSPTAGIPAPTTIPSYTLPTTTGAGSYDPTQSNSSTADLYSQLYQPPQTGSSDTISQDPGAYGEPTGNALDQANQDWLAQFYPGVTSEVGDFSLDPTTYDGGG